MPKPQELKFLLFTAFTPGGPLGTPWDHPGNRDFDYLSLRDQTRLAQALERGRFDGFFWADFSGVHDTYQNSPDAALKYAVQFPIADPMVLAAALAGATEHLGFGFSANMTQQHPYNFARRVATLDHLTDGRTGWNIVTSYQPSAWRNSGFHEMGTHANRYERATEYVDVVRKLLLESWDDDAVVRDYANSVYADPGKVHAIEHKGEFYSVPGIGLTEPSPQRMPVTFQAGTSDDGRAFASKYAEAMFIGSPTPESAATLITDMSDRLKAVGRSREDMLFFQAAQVLLASTEREAEQKNDELDERLRSESNIAFFSSTIGYDLSGVDLDVPLSEFPTESLTGTIKVMAESAPDKSWTVRDLARMLGSQRIIGTPEKIADELEKWSTEGGVDGINLNLMEGVQGTFDFIDHAVPVLQSRGLMQREYTQGTFREKLRRR